MSAASPSPRVPISLKWQYWVCTHLVLLIGEGIDLKEGTQAKIFCAIQTREVSLSMEGMRNSLKNVLPLGKRRLQGPVVAELAQARGRNGRQRPGRPGRATVRQRTWGELFLGHLGICSPQKSLPTITVNLVLQLGKASCQILVGPPR